jgi:hypothetical protein
MTINRNSVAALSVLAVASPAAGYGNLERKFHHFSRGSEGTAGLVDTLKDPGHLPCSRRRTRRVPSRTFSSLRTRRS